MSGKAASEEKESSGGLKKQNFTAEADLTEVTMHENDDEGYRRRWAECVATITSPDELITDEGDMVSDRPISCLIRPKSRDITDAAAANGELSFSPALQNPDGGYLTKNEFGMILILSESQFQHFWDYQFGHRKPKVCVELLFRGRIKKDHPILHRFTWKTLGYTGEGCAYLRVISLSLDYQWSDKSSGSS
jgi:hypothetical protein